MDLEQELEKNILPNLTRETCKIIHSNQNLLKKISWSEGENNKDMPFSDLAKKCCIEAFRKINTISDLKLNIDIPDLKLSFQLDNSIVQKKEVIIGDPYNCVNINCVKIISI